LLLVLALPALLAPSSWALRLCFCQAVETCCAPEDEPECCGDESGVEQGGCAACHSFEIGNSGVQNSTGPTLPEVAAPTIVDWVAACSLPLPRWTAPLRGVGPAPPSVGASLPLRL
jgi:hypothetical protein